MGQVPKISEDKTSFQVVNDVRDNLKVDLKYLGSDNFCGRPIDGYKANKAFLQSECFEDFYLVLDELKKHHMGLIIYDSYRPKKAVEDFIRWGESEASSNNDMAIKKRFYPDLSRAQLFEKGYLNPQSSHCLGYTMDVGIYNLKTEDLIDTGCEFDFFGEYSHTFHEIVKPEHLDVRRKLVDIMSAANFDNYEKEWWHFSWKRRAEFPHVVYNFDIE